MDKKELVCSLFNTLGGSFLLRKINSKPRILFYHGVSSDLNPVIAPENFHVDEFLKQMKYLKKYYDVISLDAFYAKYKKQTFTGKEVVLTFDDGYANNLYVIDPIMEKLNLPYTVFISTQHVETGEYFPTSIIRMAIWAGKLSHISIPSLALSRDLNSFSDKQEVAKILSDNIKSTPVDTVKRIIQEIESNFSKQDWTTLLSKSNALRPMTWDEVIELSKKENVIIGSHCKYHICCHENQREDIIWSEVNQSKKIIENKLQLDCKYIAYPNGDYTSYTQECVRKSNYKLGLAIDQINEVIDSSPYNVPRIGVPRSYNKFKVYMNIYPK